VPRRRNPRNSSRKLRPNSHSNSQAHHRDSMPSRLPSTTSLAFLSTLSTLSILNSILGRSVNHCERNLVQLTEDHQPSLHKSCNGHSTCKTSRPRLRVRLTQPKYYRTQTVSRPTTKDLRRVPSTLAISLVLLALAILSPTPSSLLTFLRRREPPSSWKMRSGRSVTTRYSCCLRIMVS
jgi:hypothetical protein